MRFAIVVCAALVVGCSGEIGDPGPDIDAGPRPDAPIIPCEEPVTPPAPIAREPLSAQRLLRRVHLALRGQPPSDADVAALQAAGTDEARRRFIEMQLDAALASPSFYEEALDFGHGWMRNGAALNGTTGDGYMGNDSTHLARCGDATVHAGAMYVHEAHRAIQESERCEDGAAPTRDVEPWWAPGTTVRLVGDAASEAATVTNDDGVQDCGIVTETYYSMASANGCGCGPNAAWCYPEDGLRANNDQAGSQRRDLWDEPARLIAHLMWHDRSLSDVVLGNYTVATTRLAAWYLRFGRQSGLYNEQLDSNSTWFRAEVGGALRDPQHPEPEDAEAWRELVVETLAPQLLSLSRGERSADSSRTLRWNPVDDDGPAPGLPAAGVLTMPGMNSYYPRERVRAARFVEIFSCGSFDPPPASQTFPPVGRDIATSGPCMHCHVKMDPIAIAFRRWIFQGGYVPRSRLAGTGGEMRMPSDLFAPGLEYTHRRWFGSGAARWQGEWVSDSVMTPVSQAALDANPEVLFYDTIPEDYTIFGEHPDGTMGPLGFAKVLVSSGEFDRCAVRRIYEHFVGRELNPETEARYIERLANEFVAGGRAARPFVRSLLMSDVFGAEPGMETTPAEPPEPPPTCAVNDNDLIRQQLAPTCAGCHGEGTSRPFFASLNAFEDLLAYNPRFVSAGAPDESELVHLLEGEGQGAYAQMPTVGDPFAARAARGETVTTMEAVREWILNLEAPTTPATADPSASATRRLRTHEYINALQTALGYEPTGGDEPLLATRGAPPLDPDLDTASSFYLNPLRNQVYLMSGGAAYLQQRLPEREWSTTSLLAVTQLAQGACSLAADENNTTLFRHAARADQLPESEAAIRMNIAYLYERFLHEAPTEAEIEMFFAGIYQPAETTSTTAAWTQVCSALARDPLFITF